MVNEEFVKLLLRKNVLRFGDFTLKSGRKSPYFFNAGCLDCGESYSIVGKVYADIALQNNLNFNVIFGPAYKGIPLAVSMAQALKEKGVVKRVVYDRKEVKDYGDLKDKLFVGNFEDNDKALMVDDVVTTGATKFDGIKKIQSLGKNVQVNDLIILFDRQEKGESGKSAVQELQEKGLNVYAALNANDTFEFLHNKEIDGKVYVTDEIYNNFKDYCEEYGV